MRQQGLVDDADRPAVRLEPDAARVLAVDFHGRSRPIRPSDINSSHAKRKGNSRKFRRHSARAPPQFGPEPDAKPAEVPSAGGDSSTRGDIMLRSILRACARVPCLCRFAHTSAGVARPIVEVAFVLDTTGSMAGADRRRQTQNLVDRDLDHRRQSGRRNPHGPRRLSRYRRRICDQDIRPDDRHPGSLRQSARTESARRRRLAGKRQRGAARGGRQIVLEQGPATSAASCSWSATRRRTWIMRRT